MNPWAPFGEGFRTEIPLVDGELEQLRIAASYLSAGGPVVNIWADYQRTVLDGLYEVVATGRTNLVEVLTQVDHRVVEATNFHDPVEVLYLLLALGGIRIRPPEI